MSDQLSSDLASLKISRDLPPGASPVRRVAMTLGLLTVLAAAGYLAVPKLGARVFKEQVSVTEVSMVSPVQASVQVTSTGYVVPQIWSKVGAKISGRLSQVFVKEGDVVKAGDIIATLDDADQKSAVAAARARVLVTRARGETALANLAEVKQQVDRTRPLLDAAAVPRAQFEDIDARAKALAEMVKAANAEATAAEAEVASLRVGLKDRIITAPIDGTVITKPASVGETVGAFTGGTSYIVEVADFRSLVVETDVPEARLDLVKPGTPCEIVLDAYPTRRYRGITAEFGKRVNRAKATVVVKVKFKDTSEGVLPDMSARVSFLAEEIKVESLKEKPKKIVAVEAIATRDGARVLFVIDEGKLRIAPVSIGSTLGASVELLDGPPPGTRVVKQPSSELFAGQKVKESEK